MKIDKRYFALIMAFSVFGSSSVLADTFDLECVIKGKTAFGVVDTNAVEQRIFGDKVDKISVSDEHVAIEWNTEQLIVMRSDNTVFVNGEKIEDAVCEVKNYKAVAASSEQLSAQASNTASSSELSELQQRLVVLEKENERLSKSVDVILDLVEYLADKNLSSTQRVIEKLESIAR